MVKRQYKGFTLVEMLIVMGILAILMAIGIAVATFAIQRANNIAHQDATKQLFQGLQSYYTDNRAYPTAAQLVNFGTALGTGGVLDVYMDANFDGGAAATYTYINENTTSPQIVLVCVTYGGSQIYTDGGYCSGNAFGVNLGVTVADDDLDATEAPGVFNYNAANSSDRNWNGTTWN